MARSCISSIESEYRRYKALGEAAIAQVDGEQLGVAEDGTNSIATLVWHLAGNFKSRFTDFLTTDGEKSWRDRESEFESRLMGSDEVLEKWEDGWNTLFGALAPLHDAQLGSTVTIRGVPLTVQEALHRSLAHASYHVGQIVLIARRHKADAWRFLSIPPGGSEAYNRSPSFEKADSHADAVHNAKNEIGDE